MESARPMVMTRIGPIGICGCIEIVRTEDRDSGVISTEVAQPPTRRAAQRTGDMSLGFILGRCCFRKVGSGRPGFNTKTPSVPL